MLWNKTRFGKNIFAIGGNPEAAKVSGVNVALNLLMIYALSGVFMPSAAYWKQGVLVLPPTTSALCMNWMRLPRAWSGRIV